MPTQAPSLQPQEVDPYKIVGVIRWLLARSTGTITGVTAEVQRSVTSSPIVIGGTDQIINFNINSGSPSCALPAAATRLGFPLTFKDVGGHAEAHNLTLTPNGAEKIDGLSTLVIAVNYGSVTLVPLNDGVNTGWSVE